MSRDYVPSNDAKFDRFFKFMNQYVNRKCTGTPPGKLEELLHPEFATKSPLELVFEEDQRGKRLYYAVRWETGTAKKGDFSEIYSAIVP
jgi:hypothetical protein